jgi:hypothetical protein
MVIFRVRSSCRNKSSRNVLPLIMTRALCKDVVGRGSEQYLLGRLSTIV